MIESNEVISIMGVSKVFGHGDHATNALRGVDCTVLQGEFLAIMGPSGSGKSTLLHLIGGLDSPTQGTIRIDGQELESLSDMQLTLMRRKWFGFVFQAFNLLDVLTAAENVALPLQIAGVAPKTARSRALEALAAVELSDRTTNLPGQLSGGQQQRLAIARALVTQPLMILADEPAGNLDSSSSDQIMRLLRGLADDHGQTVVMVTHDARHAAIADRVLELRDGKAAKEHRPSSDASYRDIVEDLEAEL